MIFTLKSHEISLNWDLIKRFLFDYFEWTPDQVRQALELAEAQLWGLQDDDGVRGIVITQLKHPIGVIWIASGNGLDAEAMHLLEVIEQWMKSQGIRDVKIEGRRGWGRVLEGYEEKATVFVKRLS